jgi:hypothetical protein
LFEQSVKDLSPEQGSKVKHLLQTFSYIFAKDDADFGRTSIIKHEIEVQNARPVKEPRTQNHFAPDIWFKESSILGRG